MDRRCFVRGSGRTLALVLALGSCALAGWADPASAEADPASAGEVKPLLPPMAPVPVGAPGVLPPVTLPDDVAAVAGELPAVTLPSLASDPAPVTAPAPVTSSTAVPAAGPGPAPAPAGPSSPGSPGAEVRDGDTRTLTVEGSGTGPVTGGPVSVRLRRAVAETAGPFAFPGGLAAAIVAFLLFQPRLDRSDPSLAHAGVGRDDDLLGFS